jgi:hypothetical protein
MRMLALLLFVACSAQAQTAWRCGADGRSYSDQACPQGRAVVASDARGGEQMAQAQDVVAREKALARQLVAERHEREREAATRGSGLIAIKPLAAAPTKMVKAEKEPKKKTPKTHRLEAKRTSASAAHASRQKRG